MALGAGQLALLDKLGFPMFRSRSARANPNGGTGTSNPTKLLTIYVPGGWFPVYLWCPLSDAEIATVLADSRFVQALPEPSTLTLFVVGLLATPLLRRKVR